MSRFVCIASVVSVLAGAVDCLAAAPSPGAERIAGEVVYEVSRECLAPVIAWPILKSAMLKADSGESYHIVMDEKGAELALVMNGESVEVFGAVAVKDGRKWLTVRGYADSRMDAAHELWRRYCCNDCAVNSALTDAACPGDLHGALPVTGREYPLKSEFTYWTRDTNYLWLATADEIVQISLAGKSVVRSYDRSQGLPDGAVYQLASDGKTLWIACRGSVAALAIGQARMTVLSGLKPGFARVYADGTNVWIIGDTGTFELGNARDPARLHPALPTANRIARRLEDGVLQSQWGKETRSFVGDPVRVGGRLYVGSLGGLYGFNGVTWERVAKEGWAPQTAAGRLWFIGVKGLVEHDPATGKQKIHKPRDIGDGRYAHLLLTDDAAWLTAEPSSADDDEDAGGLARLDLATGTWRAWKEIGGGKVDHVSAITAQGGAIWAVALTGRYHTEAADPGMTHIRRKTFETEAFSLLRFDDETGQWTSMPLAAPELDRRLICGHDGSSTEEPILPQSIRAISVGSDRIFASVRLLPKGYFSGYWPCIEQIAARQGTDAPWKTGFLHRPAELNLQGEQPQVLNISNGGRAIREAIGHADVLGLFVDSQVHWAVTEGCAGWFDEESGQWRKVAETGFGFYWRATAALDTGDCLYVGSDRGLVSRLDFRTGRFEILGALQGRTITGLAKGEGGKILVASSPAPLGRFPVQLQGKLKPLEGTAAEWDGKVWRATPEREAPAVSAPKWFIKPLEKKSVRDKSRGNFLWGPAPGERAAAPRFYIKEVFFPLFLCESDDGKRLWLSTFSGIVRVDVGEGMTNVKAASN